MSKGALIAKILKCGTKLALRITARTMRLYCNTCGESKSHAEFTDQEGKKQYYFCATCEKHN